jgi:hypothetical protein
MPQVSVLGIDIAKQTCSTEAEIRRHCAFEAPKEINAEVIDVFPSRFLPSGTSDSAGGIPFLTSR